MTDGLPVATKLDPRRFAVRDDLADEALADEVRGVPLARGTLRGVLLPSVAVHRRPSFDAAIDTEFLCGEEVRVFAEADGWAWAQSSVDRYVGYVPSEALGPARSRTTHTVGVPLGLVYPEPSIKAPPVARLPMGAAILVTEDVHTKEHFCCLANGGFVLERHLRAPADDFVAVAQWFVGAPYLWGGKTWSGIDCSGLIQLALQMVRHPCPRDSDMQEVELGEALDADAPLRRGDFVFWRGHVGIMVDGDRLLHANGYHMLTVIEPLAETIARLSRTGPGITCRRRVGRLTP